MTETTGRAKRTEDTETWTDAERAAMQEHAKELKIAATRRRSGKKQDGEADLLAKVAEMSEPDRSMAERIHAIVRASAPDLEPKTWYGMPAYARDGKVVCFFQSAQKFDARYATFGFNDSATLDEGEMWPTAFALRELSPAAEQAIGELVKKAVGPKP